jgi:hypothetical protein
MTCFDPTIVSVFSLTVVQVDKQGITRSEEWVPGALSLGVKRPGREADHSPSSSAEAKNAWNFTPTPQYVFMVWCSVKIRGTTLPQTAVIPDSFPHSSYQYKYDFIPAERHSTPYITLVFF